MFENLFKKKIMKTKFFTLFFIIFLLFFVKKTFSQEDEFNEFKNQVEKDFSDFDKKNKQIFNDFVEKNDKEFADFLRKAWNDYEGNEPEKPKLGNKPDKKPVAKIKDVKIDGQDEIAVCQTVEVIPFALGSALPPIQKEEKGGKKKGTLSVDFFGLEQSFSFDAELSKTFKNGEITPDVIADFWESASNCNHYDLINDLMEFKLQQKLNDWAYYQLITQVSEKITSSKNHAKLMKWFLLNKSRYNTKIGYNANNVYVMVATEFMIFGKNYFSFDNTNFFILDNENIKALRSYDGNYPDARNKLNFLITQSPVLGTEIKSRSLNLSYLNGKYDINLKYNVSNIDFYNTIPQLDLPLYFNASSSSDFINSLVDNLKPHIESMDEFSAVSFLLKFAQTSFDYKTDPQQFGYEKFFFAEETVFYPFSDCEDRSIFFATLIYELLNLKVVGLEYPGHVATAVCFSENRNGDHLFYNGDKYIICDPTFVNAPVGMCMPQFVSVEAKVIPLNSVHSSENFSQELMTVITKAGGNAQKVKVETDSNGNSFVVGTYDATLTFSEKIITAQNDQLNAFVAKFDKNKKPIWVQAFSGDEDFESKFVKTSPDGSTYVAGKIGKNAQFDQKQIQLENNNLKVFLAKYDENGKFQWIKTANIPKEASEKHIVVSRFTKEGKEVSTMIFDKNKGFDNYGISFAQSGDILITLDL